MIGIDLAGRNALVTGGGRGLGRAISLRLAAAGAGVVVNYLRDGDAARAVVADIRAAGGAAIAVQADVSHQGDVERLLDAAQERLGALHVLVSNAALGVFRSPDAFDLRGVRRTFEISAWPLLDLSARLAPTFVAEGYGRIVAISSVGSRRSVPGYAALAMAKGAVEAVTPYLADHVASRCPGATANAVVPVGFHDGAEDHVPHDALRRRLADDEARTPGGRYPTLAEVASVVVYLASELASGINGQSVVVDRGWSVM